MGDAGQETEGEGGKYMGGAWSKRMLGTKPIGPTLLRDSWKRRSAVESSCADVQDMESTLDWAPLHQTRNQTSPQHSF